MTVSTMVRDAQNRAFAAEVKRRMTDLGISSPVALAQRMGVNSSTALRNILKGRARATHKTVARIAEALETDQAVLHKLLTVTPDLRTPPEDRERAIVFEDDPPAPRKALKVFIGPSPPKVTSAPPSRFSLTMEPGGTMRLTLDIGGVSPADAFKLVDQIRLAGLFGHAD